MEKRLTSKQWATRIAKSNKAFAKMSPAARRVAIAKDVIAALNSKRFVAECGSWAAAPWDHDLSAENTCDAVMGARGTRCHVCGVGALFVSALRRFDAAKVEDVVDVNEEYDRAEADPGSFGGYLEAFFSPRQLSIIECAFELGDVNYADWRGAKLSDKVQAKARAFGEAHDDPKARLRAIMRNIIANRGEFVP